ncbi:MAG: YihY family inner membrane protein [Actinomycetota bacterium]|nr:YihY family inner membrane protein [Actinomycetota bacterium]
MTDKPPNAFTRAKGAAAGRWVTLRERRPGVQHVVDAWTLLQRNNGNQYAAAITYFSFLALFPLILLAVAITGFVLHAHPAAQQDLFDHITSTVPGDLGTTLKTSIRKAIQARTSVGIIGLVGVLLTGLGWIGNLRAAIDGVWDKRPAPRNFFMAKLMNLLVLAGLGLGILLSLGLTVVGTSLTDQLLRAVNLDHLAGVHYLVKILGIALAVAGDVLIFWWLLVRLPDMPVSRRVGLQGALLAAVGFEVLKIVGTFTIAKTAHSPTAGPFAGLLAVLIWIQLVARIMLFCAAWTATCRGCALDPSGDGAVVADPRPGQSDAGLPPVAPTAQPVVLGAPRPAAGALIGAGAAGALAGAAAVAWANSRRRNDQSAASHNSR